MYLTFTLVNAVVLDRHSHLKLIMNNERKLQIQQSKYQL